jgi:hypothetical protein
VMNPDRVRHKIFCKKCCSTKCKLFKLRDFCFLASFCSLKRKYLYRPAHFHVDDLNEVK